MSRSWHIQILDKLVTVAMVMQKPSKSMDIGPILMIFARYGLLIYVNIHTKNEENLTSGSRDSPCKVKANKDLGFYSFTTLFDNCVILILLYGSGVWGQKYYKVCEDVL